MDYPSTSNTQQYVYQPIQYQTLQVQPTQVYHQVSNEGYTPYYGNYEPNLKMVEVKIEAPNEAAKVTTTTPTKKKKKDDKKKKKKKDPVPQKKVKETAKQCRNLGKEYVSTRGTVVPARKLGAPCSPDLCKFDCLKKFTALERQDIFEHFWNLGDLELQRIFMASMMEPIPTVAASKEAAAKRKRKYNNAYYFPKKLGKERVCKKYFCRTLGISERTVRTVSIKKEKGYVQLDGRGRHSNHPTLDPKIKDSVRQHIGGIEVRQQMYPDGSIREFVAGTRSLTELHRDYQKEQADRNEPSANYSMYSRIFHEEFKIYFLPPKKVDVSSPAVIEKLDKEREKKLTKTMKKPLSAKALRDSGLAYTSRTGASVPARTIRPPCTDASCTINCNDKFPEEKRQEIFNYYWSLGSLERQRAFIAGLMEPIKTKGTPEKKRRQMNNAFHFLSEGRKVRVCKLFFVNTLGVSQRTTRTVSYKKDGGFVHQDGRGKHGNHKRKEQDDKKFVKPEIKED